MSDHFPDDLRREPTKPSERPASPDLSNEAKEDILAAQELTEAEHSPEALAEKALDLFAARCTLHDAEAAQGEDLEGNAEGETEEPLSPAERIQLKTEFNIEYPERYPEAILREMLEPAPGKPWGIVIVAKHDHNGAFARTPELAGLHTDLQDNVRIRIVEADSGDEAAALLDKLAARHGGASFAICMAHGSEHGFQLGSEQEGIAKADLGEEAPVNEDDDKDLAGLGSLAESLERSTNPSACILLVSCSTGKGTRPVAKKLAAKAKRTTIAPDANTDGIEFNGKASGGAVTFDQEFSGAQSRTFKEN